MKRKILVLPVILVLFLPACIPSFEPPTPTAAPTPGPFAPCEGINEKYAHDPALGEIDPAYFGSWHASPSVGSGYTERFVFFPSGNYLFFPSQYECAMDPLCVPTPVESGTWGVQSRDLKLAMDGDLNTMSSVIVWPVAPSSPDESPYPLQTRISGITYWQVSPGTDLWDPLTRELCP